MVSSTISIPVFPIIRPRGGDFLYTRAEFDVMKNDIRLCKELGFAGVVIGLLLPDGSIDKERTKELVQLAAPMEVTFHRAFDRCNDPIRGLQDIIETGCKRILTSGQVPSAPDALDLLQTLVKEAGDNIIIMPGSGVRGNNIASIKTVTKAKEFHSSARKVVPTNMQFVKESADIYANPTIYKGYGVPDFQLSFSTAPDLDKLNPKQVNLIQCWEEEAEIQPGELTEIGGKYALKHTTRDVRCVVKDIRYKIDINTLHRHESDQNIGMNYIVLLHFRTTGPLFFDSYRKNRITGSVILIDEGTNETVGAGMIV